MQKTKMGKAMRGVSNNKYAAALMGINVPMNIAFTVGLSAMICTAIGILIIPLYNVHIAMTGTIGLKGFCSGVIVGILENIASMLLPSMYKDCVSFILLILFLLFRPRGILGRKKD